MLIDTNVWSELLRKQPSDAVVTFINARWNELYLSSIVVAEMEYGLAKLSEFPRKRQLRDFIDDLTTRCEGRILAVDLKTAAIFGQIKARLRAEGRPVAELDMLIAAQSIAADMPLVTRNLSDMARTGATIIDPWQA